MMTTIIQIGNSDNKLTQEQWALFCDKTENAIMLRAKRVHFSGCSDPRASWQNAAWVFEIDPIPSDRLKDDLRLFCELFHQDSIAWTEGDTTFLAPNAFGHGGAGWSDV